MVDWVSNTFNQNNVGEVCALGHQQPVQEPGAHRRTCRPARMWVEITAIGSDVTVDEPLLPLPPPAACIRTARLGYKSALSPASQFSRHLRLLEHTKQACMLSPKFRTTADVVVEEPEDLDGLRDDGLLPLSPPAWAAGRQAAATRRRPSTAAVVAFILPD